VNRPPPSFLGRHEFLIRRLHSLSGLVPVGAFLCVHLSVNASVLVGAASFQANVDRIHALEPLLPVVEWGFIFLPILFHAIFGVLIIQGALPNTHSYPYVKNWRYGLQRVTGIIAFVFIAAHVAHMHGMAAPLQRLHEGWFAQFDPEMATSSAAAAIQSSWLLPAVYGIGVFACVFHLANGLWTMGITWGLWTSPAGQKRADCICSIFGVGLLAVGLTGLVGMLRVDPDEAAAVREQQLEHSQQALLGEMDVNYQADAGSRVPSEK